MPGGLGNALKILNLAQNDLQSVNATDLGTYPLLEELDLSRNQVGACPPLCDQSCISAGDSLLLIFTQHSLNHSLPAVKP
jgi:hypothetical protein